MTTNLVIKLNDGENYYIIAIAPYAGEKYYITNHLTQDAKKITDDFVLFREYVENSKVLLEKVEDVGLIYEILKQLGFID